MRMLKAFAAACLFAASACNDGIAPPGGSGIALLEIGPDPLILMPGDTVQLTAIARSASGAIIPNPPVTWHSSDTTALTITATGKATALRTADSVRITARAETRTASFVPNLCPNVLYSTDPYSSPDRAGLFRLWGISGEFEKGDFDRTHVLFGGGIMYGTTEADFVVTSSPNGLLQHRAINPTCAITTPDGRYIRNRVSVNPYLTNAPVSPVRVTEEIFAPNHPLAEAVILIRYTFQNVTPNGLANFRAGLLLDWDLYFDRFNSNDYTRFNAAVGAAEAFEPTMETVGIAGINTQITSFQPVVGSWPGRSVADHMALLASGTTSDVKGPGDIWFAAGFGPFTIAPGQSQSVMIVMTAGRTREDFERRISIGRSAASVFPSIPTPLSP